MTDNQEPTGDIWKSFCAALGAEYRDYHQIQGSSGLAHDVQAIAVDDKSKRLILVSAEYNPRIAALMRVDVQATMPDVKVLVARPLAVDLAHTAREVFGDEHGNLDVGKITQLFALLAMGNAGQELVKQTYGPALDPIWQAIMRSQLPILSHILNGVQQAASIDWGQLRSMETIPDQDQMGRFVQFFLNQFQSLDNLAEDRKQGICPFPTYELDESDWEMMRQGRRIDDIRDRLKAIGVYQYFFPPKDDLALGLIDRGFDNLTKIERGIAIAAEQGHQLSPNTIVPDAHSIPEIMEEFRSQGLTLEAEFETEHLTEDGETVRKRLKVRPAESLLEKVSKVFSVKVDVNLRDFFGLR